MSILIDSGAWFGKLHARDEHHEDAQAILTACLEGIHGPVYTTSDIVDETLTLTLARGGAAGWGMIQDLGGYFGFTKEQPQLATVLEIDRSIQIDAWTLFERHYDERGLSFTDCTSLAAMRDRGIDKIASFDERFDGLVERVDGPT